MTLTVCVSVIEAGVALGNAAQESVYVVCPIIGLVVFPAEPEELPVHESPFVPVTLHDDTFFTFQYTLTVSPFFTKNGLI